MGEAGGRDGGVFGVDDVNGVADREQTGFLGVELPDQVRSLMRQFPNRPRQCKLSVVQIQLDLFCDLVNLLQNHHFIRTD
jgi:hypothetical protein